MEMNWLLKKKVIMIVNILLTIKKGRFTLEDKKTIKGYEGHYSITQSGKIYSHKRKRTMKRCGDEYGFHIVKLSKMVKLLIIMFLNYGRSIILSLMKVNLKVQERLFIDNFYT
ncbi:NUMOD4 domain-containing protein [Piscibacillus salipiscarius]|uniref:NUMOD4 domain-containing protein n=1 Tax=Piscibacillus salipiscarius TaxID=299480 RepID=UPI0006CFCBA6|nr:NUMOD4 domain-containing protein [Piscibacillus salipiscarius]